MTACKTLDTTVTPIAADAHAAFIPNTPSPQSWVQQQILDYYNAATQDYRFWSKGFNMHFGYWRLGLNPLRRESMLEEMNRQVLQRLGLSTNVPARVADLGCGTGATARAAVRHYPTLSVDAVTLVPKQVAIGEALNQQAPRGASITFHCADYAHTPLPDSSYDGVYFIESACHAEGPTKQALLLEAFRLLKPGGRLVMVDAMLRRKLPHRGFLMATVRSIYQRWCVSWAVPELCRLDLLPQALRDEGFAETHIEDLSWRVVPSIAHVPLFTLWFAISEIVKLRRLPTAWRWRHVIAAFLTPWLGIWRRNFAYVAIVAHKPLTTDGETHV